MGIAEPVSPRWRAQDVALTVCLGLTAGTLAKLPLIFNALDTGSFAARNLGGIIAAALIIYFPPRGRVRL